MKELSARHRPVQSYVFAAILVLLFLAVARLFAPFFSVLLWSTLLYIILSPLHRRLIKKLNFDTLKGKILRNFWAAVFALGTLVLILVPLSLAVSLFFRQILELGRYARDLLNQRPEYLHDLFVNISNLIDEISGGQVFVSVESMENQLRDFLTAQLQRVVVLSRNVVLNIGGFSLRMFLMFFTLFFFYVDGPYLARLVLHAVPIRTEYITTLTGKFMDITRNLFSGYIIVALLQSVVAYLIFLIFKVNGSLVLAVITFIVVFIPLFGATILYIPIAVIKIASGDIAGGIIFFVTCAVFISGIDNILRPIFLRDRIQLHPLIIFFAILGGLAGFGFNGFILGPIIVIFFLTVLDMFLTEHKIGE